MNKLKWLRRHWKLVLAVIYVLSPVDIIPEAIVGPLGIPDDILVVLGAVVSYIKEKREQDKIRFDAEGEVFEGEVEE